MSAFLETEEMSELVAPNGAPARPPDSKKTEIGGAELEYFLDPNIVLSFKSPMADDEVATHFMILNRYAHALCREIILLRAEVAELQGALSIRAESEGGIN